MKISNAKISAIIVTENKSTSCMPWPIQCRNCGFIFCSPSIRFFALFPVRSCSIVDPAPQRCQVLGWVHSIWRFRNRGLFNLVWTDPSHPWCGRRASQYLALQNTLLSFRRQHRRYYVHHPLVPVSKDFLRGPWRLLCQCSLRFILYPFSSDSLTSSAGIGWVFHVNISVTIDFRWWFDYGSWGALLAHENNSSGDGRPFPTQSIEKRYVTWRSALCPRSRGYFQWENRTTHFSFAVIVKACNVADLFSKYAHIHSEHFSRFPYLSNRRPR